MSIEIDRNYTGRLHYNKRRFQTNGAGTACALRKERVKKHPNPSSNPLRADHVPESERENQSTPQAELTTVGKPRPTPAKKENALRPD